MTSSALVLLMVPGVGFFYSGLARRKSALSLIWLAMMSISVVGFQWFFWGYSLTFSHTGSAFIGDLSNFGLMKVLGQPSVGGSKIPDLLFMLYQGMFAAITYVLPIPAATMKANVAITVRPSPSVPPPTVLACSLPLSSSSSGPRSCTIQLPIGPGTPMAGPSRWVASTSLEVLPFTLAPALPLLPTHSCLASALATPRSTVFPIAPTTSPTLFSELSSSGLAGSASTVVVPWLPTCVLSWPVL